MSNDTENYSASAASNTADWPEGMAPSGVNDAGRESQADIRRWKDRIDGTAAAGGTVDALTATFSPTLTALYDGRTIVLRAAGANATTTPTFSPDGLTAKTIVKAGNQALVAGDIRAAGHFLILKYNTANDVWELMNPHYGGAATIAAGTAGPKIQTAALEQTATSEAVTQATIRDAAVGQAQLKTTTASQSTTINASLTATISPTGATYTLGWFAGNSGSTGEILVCDNGTTYAATVGYSNSVAFSRTVYLYSRYVQASPPYDLGNGDISLFIMAKVNKSTGAIIETCVAPDPPWAYHGPHNLHPIHGKIQKAAGLWGKDISSILRGTDKTIALEDGLAAIADMKAINSDPLRRAEALKVEFTMEEKNIDMNVVPTLFSPCGIDEAYVMIDPVGTLTDQCHCLHEGFGEEGDSISNLLVDGYIEIGSQLDAITPEGVIAVSANWKNTV